MNFQNLLFEQDERGVVTLTINRASKLNALNLATMSELDQAFDHILKEERIKAVILTGAGEKAFVAGADITEFSSLSAEKGQEFAQSGQRVFAKIEACPKPVIAAINGFALGGGCELSMACHLRVAVEKARFGQPEVNLGIIPGYGGTQRLTQLIGKARAIELMIRGNMIGAEEAERIGLVNYCVAPDQLMEQCNTLLKDILAKAPIAIGHVIASVNAHFGSQEGYQTEAQTFGHCCETADFKEGVSAFVEKRAPKFTGK